MTKLLLVHGYRLSKSTPQGRTDINFESHALAKLEELVTLAKSHKAHLIFTSNWLSNVSNDAAYQAVCLLQSLKSVFIASSSELSEHAMRAMGMDALDAGHSLKGLRLISAKNGIGIGEDIGPVTIPYGYLPTATGIDKEREPAVLLVTVKHQKDAISDLSLRDIPLVDDREFINERNREGVSLGSKVTMGDSIFVSKLKEHLARRKDMSTDEEAFNTALDGVLHETNASPEFAEYMKSLF